MSFEETATMEFTGERFVPTENGQIKYEHLHRYALSLDFAAGQLVLDIASGEGYGAALMAQVAQSVTGVDVDIESINHAKHRYCLPSLNFLVGSCDAIPLPDSSVDVVTSFETIEHHDQHQEMMLEIKRVLKPNGHLIISSPNRLTYSDELHNANAFHVKELYYDQFNDLLKKHFKHVQIYGQRLATGSFVTPLQGPVAKCIKAFTGNAIRLKQQIAGLRSPLYFIAVCSDNPLRKELSINSLYLDSSDDLFKHSEVERTNLLKRLDDQTCQNAEALAAQRGILESQIEAINNEYQGKLSEYEGHLEETIRALELTRMEIEETNQELQQRTEKFAAQRAMYESEIASITDKYQEQAREYQELLGEKTRELEISQIKIQEYAEQMLEREQSLMSRGQDSEVIKARQEMVNEFGGRLLQPTPPLFYENAVLLEIQQQITDGGPQLRAKDLQIQELKRRIEKSEKGMGLWVASYRLVRPLTWSLRRIKQLFT